MRQRPHTGTVPGFTWTIRSAITVLAVLMAALVVTNCENPEGAVKPNTFPETRLANVPPNDTIAQYIQLGVIPEFTLYWLGDDPDGYVIAYMYRWTSIHGNEQVSTPWTTVLNIADVGGAPLLGPILVRGTPQSLFRIYNFLVTLNPQDPADTAAIRFVSDSLETQLPFAVPYQTGPVAGDSIAGANPDINQTPTRGVFIFNSPADSNLNRFQVKSVDNNDAEDPSPALVNFWTLESPGPRALFTATPANDQFVLRYVTDRFPGLRFGFGALDPSTFEQQFSWSLDDTLHWSAFSFEPEAYITASDFNQDTSETHTMFLRARNRWGVISPDTSWTFTAIVPAFDAPGFPGRILIVNNNRTGGTISPSNPDSNMINGYYSQILDELGYAGKYDVWTTQSRSPAGSFPGQRVLSNYSTMLLTSEQRLLGIPFAPYTFSDPKQVGVKEYMNAGGNLVFIGPQDADRFINNYSAWSVEIFHTNPFGNFIMKNNGLDFIGSKGRQGYPDITLDPVKVPVDSLGSLRGIILNYPTGFAETISLFDSRTDDAQFENQPLGIRFLAPPPTPPASTTYSVVHFAFPLYFAERAAVVQALGQALNDVRE